MFSGLIGMMQRSCPAAATHQDNIQSASMRFQRSARKTESDATPKGIVNLLLRRMTSPRKGEKRTLYAPKPCAADRTFKRT